MSEYGKYIAYQNGRFVSYKECTIHVSDRGVLTGDMVHDTERTFDGKIFRIREHLERLYRSLKYLRIDPGLSVDEMQEITNEVVRRNEPLRKDAGDFWVSQLVSRGQGGRSGEWRGVVEKLPPTVIVRVHPIQFWRFSDYYNTGARAVIVRTRAFSPEIIDPKVKHNSRINFVLAELEASDIDSSAYPVLLDLEGNIAESVAGNFFLVTAGALRTPRPINALDGITRQTVLEIAKRSGIRCVEQDLQLYDAYNADEVFLTTTSYCILPISSIDGRQIADGRPGPMTKSLLASFSELVGFDFVKQALEYSSLSNRRRF